MGNYDAEIRVSTKVETSQMQKLQIQIDKTCRKVETLTKEYDELRNKKIPTKGYTDLENKLNAAKDTLASLIAEEEKMANAGLAIGAPWDNLIQKEADAQLKIEAIEAEMQKLVDTGKAFTFGGNNDEINNKFNELESAKAELRMLITKMNELGVKPTKVSDGLKKIGVAAKRAFGEVNNGVKKSSGLLSTFTSRLKGIALSLLIFNWISKGFNTMISGMKKGFENFMGYSSSYVQSVQDMKNAMSTLGNQFAAAFAPIVQMIIPWLTNLINAISIAMNYVAQFIAILSGKNTFVKAKQVQDSFNKSLGGTASAAKKAYGALARFDDLDVLQKKDDAAGGAGEATGDLFEEVPVDNKLLDFAKKLKDIFSKLFAPLKEAWEREGEFVMNSWKYALEEIWKLIKDIGRDFLTVWNQEATIQMLADLLHILGDVGLIVGNIAHSLDEAWNKNNTGLHILENIRDIFAVIIRNIREAADFTVEWSKKLDFSPLLESIEHLTRALVPFADFVSGTLADFYTQFILPLTSWTLSEEGMPRLINILGDFMDAVDWESLRTALKNLYIALEPYVEAIGEGLIDFIEKLKGFGIDFLNSLPVSIQALANALESGHPDKIREWASAILEFVAAIKALKFAFKGFVKVGEAIGEIVAIVKVGVEGVFSLLQVMNPGMIGEIGIKLGDLLTGSILDPREWDNWIGDWANAVYDFLMDGADRLGEFLATTFSIENTLSWFDKAYESFKRGGIHILEGILEGFVGALILIPEVIVNFFEAFWNELCCIFGIASPAKEMNPIGEYILLGIVEGFRATFSYFTEVLKEWWENYVIPWFSADKWMELGENIKLAFIEIWTGIQEWFSEFWAIFTENLFAIWENIILFFTEAWENITLLFQTFIDFINETVIPIWQESWNMAGSLFQSFHALIDCLIKAVKELFDGLMKSVKLLVNGDWKGAWDTAKEVFSAFKSKVDEIIKAVRALLESFFEWVSGMISGVLESISNIGSAVKGAFSGGDFSGKSALTAAAAVPYNFNDMPHLANGAVIRGGNPFMAVLGDQRAGQTNIEAPLSTIRQAVREEMAGMNFGGGNISADMTLDGETVARLLVPYIIDEMGRQGLDVDILGVT